MDNVKDNVKIFFGCEDVHSLMFFIIFQEVILDFGQFFDRGLRGRFSFDYIEVGRGKSFLYASIYFSNVQLNACRYLLALFTQKRSSENVQLPQTDTVLDDLLFIMVKLCINYDKSV